MPTTTKRRDRIIDKLREIAVDLSGLPAESFKEDVSFLELGLDSLFLTQISAAYQKEFRVRVTFRQLFDDLSTLLALGSYIDANSPADPTADSGPPSTLPVQAPLASAPPIQVVKPDVEPAPSMPRRIVAPMSVATYLIDPTHNGVTTPVDGLEAVLLQQLDLMSEQLQLLQGFPIGCAAPLRDDNCARVPAAPELPLPQSASVAAASDAPKISEVARTASLHTTGEIKEVPVIKMPAGFGPGNVKGTVLHPIPPQQQRHLDSLIENYSRKTAGSKQRTQKYRGVLADPRTAAGFNRRWKEIVYPIWVQRSLGSNLWDVDDNEYVDLLNGFGPHFLGHAPAYVTKAMEEQLKRGYEIGPQTPLVGEVAEMICQLTGMDRASFACSGSEAVQAAMRLSRTVTGRDKIVVFSKDYHGNFDQVLVREANRSGKLRTLPSVPGIPFQSVDDTYVLEYGTEESLEIIKRHADEIAAVIVEPVQSRRPEFQPKEFLVELRKITRESGIVYVFDEVVTGFRAAPGGAQAYFGIEADLATYGKVVGGGMPIGIVAGRASIMDTFDGGFWQYGDESFPQAGVTFFAGTFVRHPLTIAATHAALKYLIKEGPALQQRVADKAARVATQVNDLFKRYEVDIELPRFTSQMYLRVKEQAELANLLCFHLRYRGVHILEGFPCYTTDGHTDQDIAHIVRAFTESVESMVEDGIFGNSSKLPNGSRVVAEYPTSPTAPKLERVSPLLTPEPTTEQLPSDAQKEMWIAAQIRPEASAANNGCNVVELIGDLDVPALKRAIDELMRRHEALRSTFSQDGTKLIVSLPVQTELRIHDLCKLSRVESASRVSHILEEEGRRIFDLATGPLTSFQLIELSPRNHLFVFTAQMVVCDGWGFKVVLEEIGALYSAFVEGREPCLEAPKQMREYVSWQARERDSAWTKECEDFWLSKFDSLPPPFELPTSRPRPPSRSFEAARESLRLSAEFYRDLKRAARELRNTPFALLLSAYEIWLHRLNGIDDFVIGVPFAAQGALELNTLVGQCVHTLPFRVRVGREASFADQLNQTRKLVLDSQDHWNSNFGAIVQKLHLPSDPSRIPLVPVMFNLDPPLSGVGFSGCVSRITSGPRFYFPYDLGFNLVDEGETLLVECDYNTNLFDDQTIRIWLGSFQTLLEGIVAEPKLPISRLPLLSEGQRQQRITEYGAPASPIQLRNTLHGLVLAQVARTPDAPAVECEGQHLTYLELDNRSGQLANYLRDLGVATDSVVAVCVNRSLDLIVAILGVLKAGYAFALIDPECPKEHTEFIVKDSGAVVLLTDEIMALSLAPQTHAPVVCLDSEWDRIRTMKDNVDSANTRPEDLACICYTSGSAGRSKGVEITHEAVANLLLSMATAPGLQKNEAMLASSNLSLGTAIIDLFLPLTVGARTVLAAPQIFADPAEFGKAIERLGVTAVQAAPTTWRMLLSAGWKGNRLLKVLSGGEPLTPDLVEELLGHCGELWNLYGTTETAVWTTVCKLDRGAPITIGRPIANTQVYIVDDRLESVPAGVPGEILIGGIGLSRQYHSLTDLSAERFIPDPYSVDLGGRLFRTGDIARCRPDGQIEFVGRQDKQVNVGVYRIRVGDIESTLLEHTQVREALVTVREEEPDEPRLIAYISCCGAQNSFGRLPSEIRALVRSRLPAYMVPSALVILDRMPRTFVGRVDRNSLPRPSADDYNLAEDEYTAPRDETEARLARLWCDTLSLDQVSTKASFFDLGGQSLLAVSLFAQIEREFGRKLPLATLFTSQTIERLAIALKGENSGTAWSPLVPIQTKGSKPPLFLVHGAGGNVLLYRILGQYFAPDYPLYGLQSKGLDGESAPLRTIEEMAACYLREVKKVQPKGPYYLGGYCLGGTIAYEMAQILHREGEEVPLLAMLDTYNFSLALKVSFQSFLFQKVRFHFANLVHLRPSSMIRYFREKTRLALGGELANLSTSRPGSSRQDGVSRATSGPEAEVQSINDYAAEHYDPKPYAGRLALFKPRFNYKFYPDPQMGWGNLALSGLDIIEVAVNPHSMLLEPYVTVLASQLKDQIDRLSSGSIASLSYANDELSHEQCHRV